MQDQSRYLDEGQYVANIEAPEDVVVLRRGRARRRSGAGHSRVASRYSTSFAMLGSVWRMSSGVPHVAPNNFTSSSTSSGDAPPGWSSAAMYRPEVFSRTSALTRSGCI